ncbi:hypothetical protein EG856_01080 [Mycoplasmopsis phocirhinis]|uniref:Restriction endonuclease n=1 Tax=Mycoplasmopsis phocirhinis TaxID=142650 RepID=A0A4P6MR13_9BACT|nr:hypothetical protein [Mycoplasmopsis phocirhinis]QBF34519.1 hypothetical protein EG856_01080 [Mycoplasmopsis phocirhinis]
MNEIKTKLEELFNKGKFQKINLSFVKEGVDVLQQINLIQEKYNKNDTDTFINELRDSIVGNILGYDLINTKKHGFDCKKENKDIYLEVKDASFTSDSWQATFNDTTLEKAKAFQDPRLYLALAVWKGASDLMFICYGQNKEIGEFLEQKVNAFTNEAKVVRSTQSITLSKLIFTYGFKIYPVSKSKEEIKQILKLMNKSFNNLTDDMFRILD